MTTNHLNLRPAGDEEAPKEKVQSVPVSTQTVSQEHEEPKKKEKSPKEHKKFNWGRFFIVLAIVLATAVAVGGAVWYVMDQNAKQEKEATDQSIQALESTVKDLQSQISELNKDVDTTETDSNDTASWKTYTSTQYGFSIKYPETWTVTDTSPAISNGVPAPNPTILFKDSTGNDFRIYVSTTETGWGMESIKVGINYTGIVTNKELELSNRKQDQAATGTGYVVSTNAKLNNFYYMFHTTGSNAASFQAGDILFNKMINTLRFT